jgi:hypothetical protein
MRGVAAVAVACVTGMAGVACAGSGGDPLASMSAKQVLTRAVTDLMAAPTFGISRNVSYPTGKYTEHLDFKRGAGCKGTVAVAGKGSFAFVLIGTTVWVQPDDKYWRTELGSNGPIAQFHGRYLKEYTNNASTATETKLCDVNSLAHQLSGPTDVVKGKLTTLGGQQVLPLTDKHGTLYVTDTSSPQVVELVTTAAGSIGKDAYTVGNPVTLTAPPASESIAGPSFGF